MSYPISNVNILTETFESLIIRQNALAWLTTNDVLTANATGADTGNTTTSKIGRLYGTFMSNTVIVQDVLRGGNVSASANLTVTSNVDVYVAAAATSVLRIGNSTSVSVVNSVGAAFGSGTSNTSVSNSVIVTQSSATVNTIVNATSVVVSNGSVNTSINYLGLTAGNVVANQTVVVVGANVIANTTSLRIGNSTVNTVMTDDGIVVSNSTVSTTASKTTLSTNGTLSVTGSATLANTLAVTGAATLSNTLFVAGTANVENNLNNYRATGTAPFVTIGNSTSISTVNSTGAAFGNVATNTSVTNDSILIRNSLANTVANTTGVYFVNSTVQSSLTRVGLTAGNVVANQTVVVVGANVVVNTSAVFIGNSTVNAVANDSGFVVANSTVSTTVSKTTLSTNGTLSVTGSAILANTLGLTGAGTFSNTVAVTGSATLSNTLAVTGNVSINSDLIVKTDLIVQVNSNADIGSDTSNSLLVYRYPKVDFSTAKLLVQVKKGNNTQISEIIMAHNGSASELTVYGTVSSPPSGTSAPLLATFTSNLNNANVELFILQTQANSSVKIVADLIR